MYMLYPGTLSNNSTSMDQLVADGDSVDSYLAPSQDLQLHTAYQRLAASNSEPVMRMVNFPSLFEGISNTLSSVQSSSNLAKNLLRVNDI